VYPTRCIHSSIFLKGVVMAAARNKAVFGIYSTADQAERAVNALIRDGFGSEDVSVLMPDQRSTREFAHHKDTKAPEGATAGVTAGGIVGGTLGVLVGLGALVIPGVGPLLAAGPIVAGLAGLGAGGAVGGLIGALAGMGIPEYEARRYEGRVKDGGILLSVHCETPGDILRAREILTGTGAADIASSSESAGVQPTPAPDARPADRA
jgi:heat induced stress protein YflT